ncbi:MAG: hypothetical protein HY737_08990 [Candidatus Omnitrophica bacterium]|nr:hypothetical protein [Candidatus Omnitrophota bacterium]
MLPPALAQLSEGRKQTALILCAAVAGAVLLAQWVCVPAASRLSTQRAMLSELKAKHAHAAAVTQQPVDAVADRARQQRRQALEARLGRSQSLPKILEELQRRAGGHRLAVVITPARPDDPRAAHLVRAGPSLTLREVLLNAQLTGTLRDIAEFLGALSGAPFASSVRAASLTASTAAPAPLRANVQLAVYLPAAEAVPPGMPSTAAAPLPIESSATARAAQQALAGGLAWGRDPFPHKEERAAAAASLHLEGILWDAAIPMAIINGQTLGVGDTFEGYRITAITNDEVSLSNGADTFQLHLSP